MPKNSNLISGFVLEGLKTGEIYEIISVEYDTNCMHRIKVYEWEKRRKGEGRI